MSSLTRFRYHVEVHGKYNFAEYYQGPTYAAQFIHCGSCTRPMSVHAGYYCNSCRVWMCRKCCMDGREYVVWQCRDCQDEG